MFNPDENPSFGVESPEHAVRALNAVAARLQEMLADSGPDLFWLEELHIALDRVSATIADVKLMMLEAAA